MDNLKHDVSATKDLQNSLIQQVKESLINTLNQEILMNYVLKYFDESGNFLGLNDGIHATYVTNDNIKHRCHQEKC